MRARALLLALVGAPAALSLPAQEVRVAGTVRDGVSGLPVAFAVVRLRGDDRSTLTFRSGAFSLRLAAPGAVSLDVRKIGYRPRSVTLDVRGDTAGVEIRLDPVPVDLAGLTVTGEREDPALAVMRQAIARKRDVLSRLRDYRYDAYVKLVVRDLSHDPDSVTSMFLLTETLTTAFWKRPDAYQEVIRARRQSSNLDAEENLVSVGQIVNFNRNRIDIGPYSVVSPTADDALEFYAYRMLDTLRVGDRRVFRLAVEPRSDHRPLFVGMIDIADSTFDVRAVDVGANDALRFPLFTNLRYRQDLDAVGMDIWMPTRIRFSGELHLPVPLPGLPAHLGFVHEASLRDFVFDHGETPPDVGEYVLVVDEGADDLDSAAWAARRPFPLDELERKAWTRIDSIENAPDPPGRVLLRAAARAAATALNPDFFHFSRVEGAYVGAGVTLRDLAPSLVLRAKTGYALEREAWQHEYGAWFRLWDRRRLWAGLAYRDAIRPRPVLISAGRNTTLAALWDKDDPLDYYRERGFEVSLRTKVVDFVRLDLVYRDVEHEAVDVVTGYSLVDRDEPPRPNPPVVPGRLRSLAGALVYDSRRRIRRGGRDFLVNALERTEARLEVELASPDLLSTDFRFVRFSARLMRRQRIGGLGMTTLRIEAGAATGTPPPQRYFTVDFGSSTGFFVEDEGFNTLEETNFSGNVVGMVHLRHDFGTLPFSRSGLPLLRALPFTLGLHGGFFVTDFVDHTPPALEGLRVTAPTPYAEAGVGIGNLVPPLQPLDMSVWFIWQVSGYDTRRFRVAVGVPRP